MPDAQEPLYLREQTLYQVTNWQATRRPANGHSTTSHKASSEPQQPLQRAAARQGSSEAQQPHTRAAGQETPRAGVATPLGSAAIIAMRV